MSGPQVQRTTTGSVFNATSSNYSDEDDRNFSFTVSDSKVVLKGKGANGKVEYTGFKDPDGTDLTHPVTYGWFLQNKTSSFIGHARARTTANLASTYANGASGVGATLTGSANGALPDQDGVSLAQGDFLLVMDQTSAEENGRYEVTQLGDAGTPFILTRSVDCDEAAEFINATVPVSEGTLHADTNWQCTANAGLVVGTGAVQFVQFGATVADGAITEAKLANGAVTSDKLGPDSVLEQHIADDQVRSEHIEAGALQSEHYAAQSVDTAAIADGNVTRDKIADDAIDATKLADNAVLSEHIADGAVMPGKLANDAVVSDNIAAGQVGTTKIAPLAINSGLIANNAVTFEKIDTDAVRSDHIQANAVTSSEIAPGAVDFDQLATDAVRGDRIQNGAITTEKLDDDAVDSDKLADNAVQSAHISNSAVGNAQLADNSIDANKIQTNAVTSTQILNGAVNSDKIGSNAVGATHIIPLSVGTGHLADDSVTTAKLAHNLKWDDLQDFGTTSNYLEFQSGLDYTVGEADTHSFMVGATERLLVNSSGVHFEGNQTQSSDPKWKDGMKEVMEPMMAFAAMEKLFGISWFWKDAAKGPTEESGQRSFGINAEHLQAVLPEAVQYSEAKDGLIVQYNALHSLLIQALKGSRMHIVDLEKRLQKLEELCGCGSEPSSEESKSAE